MRCLSLSPCKTKIPDDKDKNRSIAKDGSIETAGGHTENFSARDGFLTKKTNRTEGMFYERLMSQKFGLSEFTPKCFVVQNSRGTFSLKKDIHDYSKVTLENLCQGFDKPLIYDIKLGIKTVSFKELRATGSTRPEVLRKDVRMGLIDNVTSSKTRGYRFVGSSISKQSRLHAGTHPDEMIQHMGAHLSSKDLSSVIVELEKLHSYLMSKEGRMFEIIGASVLIVAELGPKTKEIAGSAQPKVKLIDFAHSSVAGPKGVVLDNGVLFTPRRKKIYQRGLQKGLARLTNDLRTMLENKRILEQQSACHE